MLKKKKKINLCLGKLLLWNLTGRPPFQSIESRCYVVFQSLALKVSLVRL